MAQNWQFVAAGTSVQGSNSISVPLPTGWQQGDLLVMPCAGGPSTPSGWTSATGLSLLYKFAGASESAVTLTNFGSNLIGAMVAYRNINSYDKQSSANGPTSGTSITTNTLTTTKENELIISLFLSASNGRTWTSPANTTQRINIVGQTTAYPSLCLVDENQLNPSTTTARTGTTNLSASLYTVVLAFQEKPNDGNFFFMFN